MGRGREVFYFKILYILGFFSKSYLFSPFYLYPASLPPVKAVLFTLQFVEGYNSVKFNPNICLLKQLKCSPTFASRWMTNREDVQRTTDETQV